MDKAATELLIATHNQGKMREWQKLLANLPFTLKTLREFPLCPVAPENEHTFAANATSKSRFYSAHTQLLTVADDSGLAVDALGGAPGVLSARYGEIDFTDAERTNYLLAQLSPFENRTARFVCVVAVCDATQHPVTAFEATCEGTIARQPQGANGFGYDSIFIPCGYDKTFAELDEATKNRLSHRALAARKVREFLIKLDRNGTRL